MSFASLESLVHAAINTVVAEAITYTPVSTGIPLDVRAVYEQTAVEVQGIQSVKPSIRIVLAELGIFPEKGDIVLVRGINFKIENSQVDSFGSAILLLKKA